MGTYESGEIRILKAVMEGKCKSCFYFDVNKETLTPKERYGINTKGICRYPLPIPDMVLHLRLPFWVEFSGSRQTIPDSPVKMDKCPAWRRK